MRSLTIVFAVIAGLATSSRADITVFMTRYDSLKVEITRGKGVCSGGDKRTTVFSGEMKKGFRQTFTGTGDKGDNLCWRRSEDPKNPKSELDDMSRRCSHDGDCEIR